MGNCRGIHWYDRCLYNDSTDHLTPEDVWCSGESGVALTMAAVETVIPASISNVLVTLCIFGFCFSTVLSFYVYYETACVSLFGEKAFKVLKWLYFIFPLVFAGYRKRKCFIWWIRKYRFRTVSASEPDRSCCSRKTILWTCKRLGEWGTEIWYSDHR